MSEVSISINGRAYDIACDKGQEGRITDLASFIDQKMKEIAGAGAAFNDSHLLVLTSLVIADELFELKNGSFKNMPPKQVPSSVNKEEEQELVSVIESLAKRIDGIASKIEKVA